MGRLSYPLIPPITGRFSGSKEFGYGTVKFQDGTMSTKLHRREPHRLIRLPEVLRKVGVSQSSWYEDVKEKRAPSPVKISARSVAWYEPDIDDLIDARREGREWQPIGDVAAKVIKKFGVSG